MRLNRSIGGLTFATVLAIAGCDGGAATGPPVRPGPGSPSAAAAVSPSAVDAIPVKVAFLESLAGSDEADRQAATAFQATALAFSNAAFVGDLPVSVEVVAHDTGTDLPTAVEAAAEVAADPEVIAAIGAPGLDHQAAIGGVLDAVGMPWISLSGIGDRLGSQGWDGWRRMVADVTAQGQVLAHTVDAMEGGDRSCLMGDGTAAARSLLRAVARGYGGEVVLRAEVGDSQAEVTAAAGEAAIARCGTVVWAGEGTAAAALRRQLVEEGLRDVVLIGGDRMRDQGYLDAAGPAAEGTFATCPCLDLSTSTDLAAQRFIQDFQAEFGLPPGPYAVEAWDAARLLVNAFRGGATTREATVEAVSSTSSYDGLGGVYRFGDGGDLAAAKAHVRVYQVAGGRWLETSPSP